MTHDAPMTRLATSLLALACAATAGTAAAQVLDEIVVTAQKREQVLHEVPISVAVLDDKFLENRQMQQLFDLQANVPNLFVNNNSGSPTTVPIYIRGLGQNDTQITLDPSVALYLDGVYVGSALGSAFDTVDLERIEVLRGPQGTLYGRNATGGAVNLIGRRANPEAVEFDQEFTSGNLGVFNSLTRINLPLGDRFAVKLNYLISERDELTENRSATENFGMLDNQSAVVDVRWLVTDKFTVDYRYDYMDGEATQVLGQLSSLTPLAQFFPIVYSDVSENRLDRVSSTGDVVPFTLDIDGHSLNLNWDVSDSLSLRSITAYREFDNGQFASLLPTAALASPPFPPDSSPFFATENVTFEQFSQELQLLWSCGQFEWVVGAFYYEDEAEDYTNAVIFLGADASYSDSENESLAAYAQATWTPRSMDERWHITLGGRYSDDQRKALRDNPEAGIFNETFDEGFSNFSPSLSASFDLTADSNIYGTISQGFRSGGTSTRSANLILFAEGFEEEEVTNYELGYKGSMWDGRAQLNAAVFTMDVEGLQISAQTGPSPAMRDFLPVDGTEISGLEADLRLAITEGLVFSLSYGYLDTKLGESTLNTPAGVYLLSETVPWAPENTAMGALDYHIDVPLGSLDFNLNYSYVDSFETSINSAETIPSDAYGIWGSALTWSEIKFGDMPGSFTVMAWGRNLTDDSYHRVRNGAFSSLGVAALDTFGTQRNYGVTVKYNY